MRAKPLPIKHVCELVANDLEVGGFDDAEGLAKVRASKCIQELISHLDFYMGIDGEDAMNFVLSACIEAPTPGINRCFICGRPDHDHKDSDYNAEGMCTRTVGG